jgi:hypothetical protein
VPRDPIPADERYILRILGEATDPLFPSEITERLNQELGAGAAYTMTEVVMRLKSLNEQVVQLPDGRWNLERRTARRYSRARESEGF